MSLKQNTIIMKKKVLVTTLSVMTVTLLCVFTLAPIAQAQTTYPPGMTWYPNGQSSKNYFQRLQMEYISGGFSNNADVYVSYGSGGLSGQAGISTNQTHNAPIGITYNCDWFSFGTCDSAEQRVFLFGFC
jgi:hypothetical protein